MFLMLFISTAKLFYREVVPVYNSIINCCLKIIKIKLYSGDTVFFGIMSHLKP